MPGFWLTVNTAGPLIALPTADGWWVTDATLGAVALVDDAGRTAYADSSFVLPAGQWTTPDDEREARRLSNPPYNIHHVAWSPDGKTLAVTYNPLFSSLVDEEQRVVDCRLVQPFALVVDGVFGDPPPTPTPTDTPPPPTPTARCP